MLWQLLPGEHLRRRRQVVSGADHAGVPAADLPAEVLIGVS
jgi:hypothetical protein